MLKTCRVLYEGRVQGVGFRFTTKQIATGHDVTGTVKNLPDGRVELVVTGDACEVDAFLLAVRDSGLGALIRNETVAEFNKVERFAGFRILP